MMTSMKPQQTMISDAMTGHQFNLMLISVATSLADVFLLPDKHQIMTTVTVDAESPSPHPNPLPLEAANNVSNPSYDCHGPRDKRFRPKSLPRKQARQTERVVLDFVADGGEIGEAHALEVLDSRCEQWVAKSNPGDRFKALSFARNCAIGTALIGGASENIKQNNGQNHRTQVGPWLVRVFHNRPGFHYRKKPP
jgi:hypothetical protein